MRTCLKCKGEGKIYLSISANKATTCIVCAGNGMLPHVDKLKIMEDITHGGKLVAQLYPDYKQCMSMISKPGPWGKTPHTIGDAAALWKGTVHGRRCTYVHCLASYMLGAKARLSVIVSMACNHDPFKSELDTLVGDIVSAQKNK